MTSNSTISYAVGQIFGRIPKVAAATALGTVLAMAGPTQADVIYSGVVNLTIPASTSGLYLNVVSGASSSAPLAVPGWDINPWSSTGLGFFNPAVPVGGAYVITAPGFVANLAPGSPINGLSSFGAGSSFNISQWNLNSSANLFGFRLINEAMGGTLHYGWGRISLSDTITGPRSMVEYAYESTPGVGITAGIMQVDPVSAPGTIALFMMGLAAFWRMAYRRRVVSLATFSASRSGLSRAP